MSTPTGLFQTYTAIGGREDLIDVITTIDPVDTFVTSATGSVPANAVKHEWQTDALDTIASNAQIEGDDLTAAAITPTVRTSNTCQILRKGFAVSDTQEAVKSAGRASEVDYQTMNKTKSLARDIEYALVINATEATGASGTARQMKGLLGWITTNAVSASATTVDVSETLLNDNLAKVWAAGGKPSYTLVGAYAKRKIDAFTTNTRNAAAADAKVVAAIDVYQSSFGTIQVRLHQILNTSSPSTILNLGDMNLLKKAWLRPVKREELARTGASRKFMIEAELTLEVRQEKGMGRMYGYKSA